MNRASRMKSYGYVYPGLVHDGTLMETLFRAGNRDMRKDKKDGVSGIDD